MAQKIPFRNRAHEVSRLEAFSDVIFGFAISLLVVSLEAPKSYGELMEMMRGMLPFAVCFFVFIDIWFEHHHFFRRYALQDTPTVSINTILLFVVLFYVYPMRFVLTSAIRGFTGERVGFSAAQGRTLFTIYGLGFTAVFWLIGALYLHAWRSRATLQLNAVEENDTLESIYDNFWTGMIGVLSVIIAQTPFVGLAGFAYFLLGIPKSIIPSIMRKRRKRLEAMI
jgi:uncharacterized membrane protein